MIFSRFFGSSGSGYSSPSNPKVFFEISKDSKSIGNLVFELYKNHTPKTAENFRSLCVGDNQRKDTFAGSGFHRIIKGFMA